MAIIFNKYLLLCHFCFLQFFLSDCLFEPFFSFSLLQSKSKTLLKFCIIIESNSQKPFFRCCPVHKHGHCDITRKRRVGRSWVMYLLCIVQKKTNGSCHYSEVCALLRSSGNKNISDTVSYCLIYLFFVFTTFWCHLWSVTEQVHGICLWNICCGLNLVLG